MFGISCLKILIICTIHLLNSLTQISSNHFLKARDHFALHVSTLINPDQPFLREQVTAGQDPTLSEHSETNALNGHTKCSAITRNVGLAARARQFKLLCYPAPGLHSTAAQCSWIRHPALISMKESRAYISTGHDKIKNRFII